MDMKMFPEMTEKMNMLLMDIIAALGQLPVEQRGYIYLDSKERRIWEDSMIGNVAEVTVLEGIMTDENGGMKKFERFLGKESMNAVKHLSHYFMIDGINE